MRQDVQFDDPTEALSAKGLTAHLADTCLALHQSALPGHVLRLARHCLLDWAAVTIAGTKEPLAGIMARTLASGEAAAGACSLAGSAGRASEFQAALLNGTVSHALDFDDVNERMLGHPTVAIAPAVLAVAEREGLSGDALLRAFVGGYQVAARLGAAMGESHYARGFHATATVGAVGAAAGCSILLRLDERQTRIALSLAATQAGGLKANFGTMAKPLHAGKAAANGVLAARLAQQGFTAREDALEHDQGFGSAMSDDFQPGRAFAADAPEWEIEDNLFKFHAACYLTHSSIEALRQLRSRERIEPDEVAAVRLDVPAGHRKVCDIVTPRSGLDVKFSIRHLAALALYGENTSALSLYSAQTAHDERYVALREKVTLVHEVASSGFGATVAVDLADGRTVVAHHDVGQPLRDLDAQERALLEKAHSLVVPVLGPDAAKRLFAAIDALETSGSVTDVMSLIATA